MLSRIFSKSAVVVATLIVGAMGEPQQVSRPVVKITIWQPPATMPVICSMSCPGVSMRMSPFFTTGMA